MPTLADARDQAFALAAANPAASSVYRILDILMQADLVQPIKHPQRQGERHPLYIAFKCHSCGRTTPIRGQAAANVMGVAAHGAGFQMEPQTVKIAGHCSRCHNMAQPSPRPYPMRNP